MRRALAAAALAALVLTGCGTDDTDGPSVAESPAESSSPATPSEAASSSPSPTDDGNDNGDAIEIEIEGDRIEPNGMRVKVGVGEEVRLAVESDRAASLHVHSSPEQTLEVEAGESLLTLTIERPGVVDIEEHETGLVVLQLEVR